MLFLNFTQLAMLTFMVQNVSISTLPRSGGWSATKPCCLPGLIVFNITPLANQLLKKRNSSAFAQASREWKKTFFQLHLWGQNNVCVCVCVKYRDQIGCILGINQSMELHALKKRKEKKSYHLNRCRKKSFHKNSTFMLKFYQLTRILPSASRAYLHVNLCTRIIILICM